MKVPLPLKQRHPKFLILNQPMVLFGRRLRYLVLLDNNPSVRPHSARCAMITLKGFMATMNYADTLIAITQIIAGFGYAKTTQQLVDLALPCHSLPARHVAILRRMVRTITLPPTSDAHTSTPARTSGEAVVKSVKDGAEWEAVKNPPWTN